MKNESDLTNNYRILFALSNLHMPFRYAVLLLQKKWGLPIQSESYKEGRKNFETFLNTLKVGDWSNYRRFSFDVGKLLYITGFSPNWGDSFGIYLATETIDPPYTKDLQQKESKMILAEINSFSLSILKEVQKKEKNKAIAKMKKKNKNYELTLPKGMPRIEGDATIADLVLGDIDWDKVPDSEIGKVDLKRINRIKKYRERVKDSPYYVELTPEKRKFIDDFLNTPLMN